MSQTVPVGMAKKKSFKAVATAVRLSVGMAQRHQSPTPEEGVLSASSADFTGNQSFAGTSGGARSRTVSMMLPPQHPDGGKSSREHSKPNAGGESNYRVYIRMRPFLAADRDPIDPYCYPLPPFEFRDGKECIFIDPTTGMPKDTFLFDGAFCSITADQWARVPDLSSLPPDSPFFPPPKSQLDMYEMCAKPIVSYVLDGFNASILAYGQTSSGKTHTMMGAATPEGEGIIPRLCRDLLEGAANAMEARAGGGGAGRGRHSSPNVAQPQLVDFTMEIAFFEIYNENVLDLLESQSTSMMGTAHRKRKVRSHPVLGVYIDGLTFESVTSWEQCAKLIAKGVSRRHVASTKMNDQSSRSHAIMQLRMTQTELSELGPLQRRSNVHLADLAGSERIKLSQVEGERLKEAAQINLSLTTLRRVIDALIAPKSKNELVPYRDSLLTWVLSDSLGGNAKSCMVATLCPNPAYGEESYYTLQYASRAKSIISNVVRNEDQMAQMIRNLQEAIAKESTSAAGGGGGGIVQYSGPSADQIADMKSKEEELKRLTAAHASIATDLAAARQATHRAEQRAFEASQHADEEALQRQQAEGAIGTLRAEIDNLRAELDNTYERLEVSQNTSGELMHELNGLRYQYGELEAQLQQMRSERHAVEGRARAHAAACYMPMLRWYQGVVAAAEDNFFHSQRTSFTTSVMNTAVHQCGILKGVVSKQGAAIKDVLASVHRAEAVNRSHQETLSRVAALYVRVRDFLHLYGGPTNQSNSGLYFPNERCTFFGPNVGGTILPSTTVKDVLASFYSFVGAAEREDGIVATALALKLPGDLVKVSSYRQGPKGSQQSGKAGVSSIQRLHRQPAEASGSIAWPHVSMTFETESLAHQRPQPQYARSDSEFPMQQRKYTEAAAAATARAAEVHRNHQELESVRAENERLRQALHLQQQQQQQQLQLAARAHSPPSSSNGLSQQPSNTFTTMPNSPRHVIEVDELRRHKRRMSSSSGGGAGDFGSFRTADAAVAPAHRAGNTRQPVPHGSYPNQSSSVMTAAPAVDDEIPWYERPDPSIKAAAAVRAYPSYFNIDSSADPTPDPDPPATFIDHPLHSSPKKSSAPWYDQPDPSAKHTRGVSSHTEPSSAATATAHPGQASFRRPHQPSDDALTTLLSPNHRPPDISQYIETLREGMASSKATSSAGSPRAQMDLPTSSSSGLLKLKRSEKEKKEKKDKKEKKANREASVVIIEGEVHVDTPVSADTPSVRRNKTAQAVPLSDTLSADHNRRSSAAQSFLLGSGEFDVDEEYSADEGSAIGGALRPSHTVAHFKRAP